MTWSSSSVFSFTRSPRKFPQNGFTYVDSDSASSIYIQLSQFPLLLRFCARFLHLYLADCVSCPERFVLGFSTFFSFPSSTPFIILYIENVTNVKHSELILKVIVYRSALFRLNPVEVKRGLSEKTSIRLCYVHIKEKTKKK